MLIYFMLAGFLVVLILSSQNYNPNYLYPILGYGWIRHYSTVLSEARFTASHPSGVFAQSLQGLKHIKKEGVIASCCPPF
jgi:hypothetical protein